jgi:hypothetical protein
MPDELKATMMLAIVGEAEPDRYSPPPLEEAVFPAMVLLVIVAEQRPIDNPPP